MFFRRLNCLSNDVVKNLALQSSFGAPIKLDAPIYCHNKIDILLPLDARYIPLNYVMSVPNHPAKSLCGSSNPQQLQPQPPSSQPCTHQPSLSPSSIAPTSPIMASLAAACRATARLTPTRARRTSPMALSPFLCFSKKNLRSRN